MQTLSGPKSACWRARPCAGSRTTAASVYNKNRSHPRSIGRLSIAWSTSTTQAAPTEAKPAARPASPCLEVGFGPNGRGLFARQSLQAGMDAFTVPLANTLLVIADEGLQEATTPPIFDTTSHPNDPLRPAICELYPGAQYLDDWQSLHGTLPPALLALLRSNEHDSVVKLTAWLLWLARSGGCSSSYWQGYCASLPAMHELTNLAAFSADERQQLQLPGYTAAAESAAAVAHDIYSRHFSPTAAHALTASMGRDVSCEDVLWAYSIVSSRTFGVGPYMLLVPFADMANHHLQDNAMWRLNPLNKRTFTLTTTLRVASSSELILSYGAARNNAYLLTAYGFVLPGNPYDRITDLPGTPTSVSNTLSAASRAFVAARANDSDGGSSGGSGSGSGSGRDGSSDGRHASSSSSGSNNSSSCIPALRQLNTAALMVSAGFTLRDEGPHHGMQPHGAAAQRFLTATDKESVVWRRKLAALLSLPLQMEQLRLGRWRRAIKGRQNPKTLVGGADADVAAEREAVTQLLSAVGSMLAALPTSIEEDEAVLKLAASGECGLTSRRWAAVSARLEHKLLLRQAMELLQGYSMALA